MNPQHDPTDPAYNPRGGARTPEPPDAAQVFESAERTDWHVYYGRGQDGWYRYFYDQSTGAAHFSGTMRPEQVPITLRRE